MRAEYDFSKGIRGKYAKKYAEGSNLVILAPDVSHFFKDSDAVNKALRTLIDVAKSVKVKAHNKSLQRTRKARRRA